jgi:transposase InsO family protein
VLRQPVESAHYLAIRYRERLAPAGAFASVGSRGDPHDNALAESFNGLYKTELIRRQGSWRGLDDVELATMRTPSTVETSTVMAPDRTIAALGVERGRAGRRAIYSVQRGDRGALGADRTQR